MACLKESRTSPFLSCFPSHRRTWRCLKRALAGTTKIRPKKCRSEHRVAAGGFAPILFTKLFEVREYVYSKSCQQLGLAGIVSVYYSFRTASILCVLYSEFLLGGSLPLTSTYTWIGRNSARGLSRPNRCEIGRRPGGSGVCGGEGFHGHTNGAPVEPGTRLLQG